MFIKLKIIYLMIRCEICTQGLATANNRLKCIRCKERKSRCDTCESESLCRSCDLCECQLPLIRVRTGNASKMKILNIHVRRWFQYKLEERRTQVRLVCPKGRCTSNKFHSYCTQPPPWLRPRSSSNSPTLRLRFWAANMAGIAGGW
jgi:hypothetical protein